MNDNMFLAFLLLLIVATWGDPDLLDGVIYRLMEHCPEEVRP